MEIFIHCILLLNFFSEHGCVAWKEVCQISDDCFTVPGGYRKLNQLGGRGMIDEEEELLQLAIRQSLLEQSGGGGNVSISVSFHLLTSHHSCL